MTYIEFLDLWHILMKFVIGASIPGAILILMFHWIKLISLRDYKKKYDYLNRYSIKLWFYFFLSLAISAFAYLNLLKPDTVALSPMWYFVRLFITLCIGTLIGYVAQLVLKYSYPTKLHRKLQKLRYKPRINPKTGNTMRLLSEEEEDVHLDAGMQAEENAFSVDYDVWIDQRTGDTKIEKYDGHLTAKECERCGFQTLKVEREEIVKTATITEEGELVKHYKCSYCNRIVRERKSIAKLTASGKSSYELPEKLVFMDEMDKRIASVEVKVYSNNGISRTYDFESIEQAKEFLEEFESETID